MSIRQSLLDFCNEYTYPDADTPSWGRFFHSIYRRLRGLTPVYRTRMFLQRVFRANHIPDNENWEAGFVIARKTLKHLRAFKASKRMGYPSDFIETYENSGYTEEEYNAKIASGDLIGGGPDMWEHYIDLMIEGYEYIAEIYDAHDTPATRKWYELHYGFSPYDGDNLCNRLPRPKRNTVNNELDDMLFGDKDYYAANYPLSEYIMYDSLLKCQLATSYLMSLWD